MTGLAAYILGLPVKAALTFITLAWLAVGPVHSAWAVQLKHVALGNLDEYTRLVYTFDDQINDVVLRRDDVDSFVIDFGPVGAGRYSHGPYGGLVKSVTLEVTGGRLASTVILDANKFEVRHFLSRDRFSCVVDFKSLDELTQNTDGNVLDQPEELFFLKNHTLAEIIEALSLFIQSKPERSTADLLIQSGFNDLSIGRLDDGLDKLTRFKQQYPSHQYADPVWFVIGDALMAKGLPDNFVAAVDSWREALQTFPNSFEAPRAAFMIAEANRLMGYRNEAAGFYKICAEDYPDSPYALPATLGAADMQLAMGLTEEARNILNSFKTSGLNSLAGRLITARLGMADYLDTLYSQSCEKFRSIIDIDPNIFQLYPDMLYAIGDSYSYLNRPDLTVLFLIHALNIMPEHPKADVMLARIGNALQTMGRSSEAISYFKLGMDTFPNRDGGLISKIRLADMGAIQAFFPIDQVFDVLERGARQATVRMYDKIISDSSESPLLQLAYLKIGQAQAADGENADAIKWLRTLVSNYPKGVLLDEAKPILSRAVVNEAQKNYDLNQFNNVDILNSDNSAFLEGPDLLRFKRILAQSYDQLGRTDDALHVLQEIEDLSPEKRLSDQKDIIETALKAKKPLDAFKQIKATLEEFPDEKDWIHDRIAQVGKALGLLSSPTDIDNLLKFRNDPLVLSLDDVSRTALMDAITIMVNNQLYDQASGLMDVYRDQYPNDELSPEYLLTQAKIDRRLQKPESSWNRLSNFRLQYPDDPRVPSTILETAADARKLERLDDAYRYEELYRQLYPDDVKSRALLLNRAQELYELGRTDDSLATLKLFQSEYPDDPEVPSTFLDQYKKLAESGRHEQAERTLTALREGHPNDPLTLESYIMQYRDLVRSGRLDDGFKVLDLFQSRFPDDPRQADLLLEEARDSFAANQADRGLAAWREFLDRHPNDDRAPELTLLLARREFKENLTEPAIGHYRAYLDQYQDEQNRPQVMLELAALETALNLNQEAYDHLSAFRREYPGRPEEAQTLLDQVDLAAKLSRIDDATALYDIFRENFTNHPKFISSFLDQTRMEMAAGRTSAALATLEKGIITSPGLDNDKSVQDLLLNLYLDEGRIDDWAGATEEYLQRDNSPSLNLPDRFNKFLQVAQVYQELGRQQDAQRNFELAINNRPSEVSGESLYSIAGAYRQMGLEDKYKSVLELISQLPDPLWQNVANQELSKFS